jgi:hypothetical protein
MYWVKKNNVCVSDNHKAVHCSGIEVRLGLLRSQPPAELLSSLE